jgi:uncharacterized DUF497 family protein
VASRFEWDEEKAAVNEAKHGVSFEEATRAFADPNFVEFVDEEHSTEDETRYAIIGLTVHALLYVVFTEREDAIRIIHARRASAEMERIYEEENPDRGCR